MLLPALLLGVVRKGAIAHPICTIVATMGRRDNHGRHDAAAYMMMLLRRMMTMIEEDDDGDDMDGHGDEVLVRN